MDELIDLLRSQIDEGTVHMVALAQIYQEFTLLKITVSALPPEIRTILEFRLRKIDEILKNAKIPGAQ